jgi:hypothetical protein
VLRKIFGPKREGVAEDLSKLYNAELHDLLPGDQVKNNEMCRAERRYAYKALVGQRERKRSFESRTPTCKYNIKMD